MSYRCAFLVVVQDRLLAMRAEAILKQRVNVYRVSDVMLGSQV
jgi:hypothetical protein